MGCSTSTELKMSKFDIALNILFCVVLAWPWLRRFFSWTSAFVVVLGGTALTLLFKL